MRIPDSEKGRTLWRMLLEERIRGKMKLPEQNDDLRIRAYNQALSDCQKIIDSYDLEHMHLQYAYGHLQESLASVLDKKSDEEEDIRSAYITGVQMVRSILHGTKQLFWI